MNKIKSIGFALTFVLCFVCFPSIQNVKAESLIYIRNDGTVEGTNKIQRQGNSYTLLEDLIGSIYDMDVFITIEKDNIVFDGNQKTIQGTKSGIGIEARGRTNITIQNLRISDVGIGIKFYGKDHDRNTTASNNQFLNNHIEATYFSMDLSTNNGTVSGNTLISRTDKYGIMFNGNNTVVSNNKFVASGLIVYETLVGNACFNNTINGKPLVYLQSQSNQIIDEAAQVILMGCNNITVRNVNTPVQLRVIINLFGTNNTKISNCNGNMFLTNSHDNIIVDNQLEDKATMVSYNTAAIKLYASNNNTIKGNSIVAMGSEGFGLSGSSYNNVQGNQISSTGEAGIKIELTSVFNYIQENSIICPEGGIYFKNGAQNNFVLNNLITECKNAIMLFSSPENTFVANNISKSTQYAIYLAMSDNNTFYHNNFLYNSVAFYEQHDFIYPFVTTYYSEGNTWDNGKEGNYWSDYTGKDTNNDGIGDTQYTISGSKHDHYPLMNPVHISAIPEFPSWTVLPIIATAILLATVFRKKYTKHQKQNSA
ncbi:MAG: right-handed parallel beta-helix repeat-containing protein [Candidatus Bathyarchaeota archaeon]|nr:right-handed parallel beta-helix repeat-containing protein [Candidatus Bathyarchaeum sp.]